MHCTQTTAMRGKVEGYHAVRTFFYKMASMRFARILRKVIVRNNVKSNHFSVTVSAVSFIKSSAYQNIYFTETSYGIVLAILMDVHILMVSGKHQNLKIVSGRFLYWVVSITRSSKLLYYTATHSSATSI